MATVQQLTPAQQQQLQNQKAMQLNLAARAAVLGNAFPIFMQVDAQTFDPNSKSSFDINGQNVGLVTGFTVAVKARIKNNHATDALSITDLGIANLIRQVTYFDPNNQRHIETTGHHIALVNTIKGQKPFGASSSYDSPIKYGDNYKIIDAPATIAAQSAADVIFHYYIPLAYSDTDLTGAVFANVAQSKQRLKLEFANNNTGFTNVTDNNYDAIYKGSAAAVAAADIEEMTYTCFQHYYDQLPRDQNGQFIVPAIDLSTIYLLENTTQAGLTVNNEFKVSYNNLYRYLSTICIFANGAEYNAGTDVKEIALQTANFSNYRKAPPETWQLETRKLIGTDLPKGIYLAETRARPIYTLQSGNQSFVVIPSKVNANARLGMYYESLVTATNLVNLGTISTT